MTVEQGVEESWACRWGGERGRDGGASPWNQWVGVVRPGLPSRGTHGPPVHQLESSTPSQAASQGHCYCSPGVCVGGNHAIVGAERPAPCLSCPRRLVVPETGRQFQLMGFPCLGLLKERLRTQVAESGQLWMETQRSRPQPRDWAA